jgi:hypothetical protein
VVVGVFQFDGHVPLRLGIADSFDEAAAGYFDALELIERDALVIFDAGFVGRQRRRYAALSCLRERGPIHQAAAPRARGDSLCGHQRCPWRLFRF